VPQIFEKLMMLMLMKMLVRMLLRTLMRVLVLMLLLLWLGCTSQEASTPRSLGSQAAPVTLVYTPSHGTQPHHHVHSSGNCSVDGA